MYKGKNENAAINDAEGKIFGDWKVLGKATSRKWRCKCITCGFEKDIDKYSLEHGSSLKCKHVKEDKSLIDKQFGEWTVIKKGTKSGTLLCKCSCGTEKEIYKSRLLEGRTKSCGHSMNKAQIGMVLGDYRFIQKLDGDLYKCECIHCGNIVNKYRRELFNVENDKYRTCSICNSGIKELIGKRFNEWTVKEYVGNGKYLCECSCGNTGNITKYQLEKGLSKSCGHNTTKLKDITGKQFGDMTVIRYNNDGKWLCQCRICNKYRLISGTILRYKQNINCESLVKEKTLATRLEKYGDICINKKDNPRQQWQIDVVASKENLENYILQLGYKPFTIELANLLGINTSNILKKIHRFSLEHLIEIGENTSYEEKELYEYIKSITNEKITLRDRNTIPGYELDIYLPNRKLAFEFNGNYWHSTIFKSKKYHQDKTLAFAAKGIRLIHIFEYEWINDKLKIMAFISDILNDNKDIIYGRNTEVVHINKDICKEFLNKNHLQNYTQAKIMLGCIDKKSKQLLGVLTLDIPRFENNYEYEIVRLCWLKNTIVIGGLDKLLSHFIREYKPKSIVTYSDISKFTGNTYLRSGFKLSDKPITAPGYVWVSHTGKDVLSRYMTQKQKLIANNLGTEEETEDEIMNRLDYYKIYNSGNIKLEWRTQ